MMRQPPGMIKRAYDALALLALLNMVGLAAAVALLAGTGALDGDKVKAVVEILRGPKAPEAAAAGGAGRSARTETGSASATGPEAPLALSDTELEIVHREAERIKTEIDQRSALANSIMLKVRTEREAFRKERESSAKQEQAALARQREQGFQKQILILESLSPKTALEHLLGMNDPDLAAKMLSAMDTDRAKKIVESAKRGDELTKMKVIVRRMEEVGPGPAEDLRAEVNGGGS